ncbi:MAG: NAD(P)H-dependent oxidoreductase [Actinomycetota bacterium]|nr:NAD(P)H-dependent oxidoreductase [Actinomycetota bacterium]
MAVLRTAAAVAPPGVAVTIYDGLATLPHFNPDDDGDRLDPAVERLRASIDEADALLFCTPEYAGALPGSFKNLLDWTVGGVEINDKSVGWINASTAPTGAVLSHDSLRHVLSYVGADIIEAACVRIGVPRESVGVDGTITDARIRSQVAAVVLALTGHASK